MAVCPVDARDCKLRDELQVGSVCLDLNAQPNEIITYKTIGERTLNLHVFKAPETFNKLMSPALLLFHGGGWNSGTPTQMYDQAPHFINQKWVL